MFVQKNYTLHIVIAWNENYATQYKATYIFDTRIKAYIYSENFIALGYRLTQLFFRISSPLNMFSPFFCILYRKK